LDRLSLEKNNRADARVRLAMVCWCRESVRKLSAAVEFSPSETIPEVLTGLFPHFTRKLSFQKKTGRQRFFAPGGFHHRASQSPAGWGKLTFDTSDEIIILSSGLQPCSQS